MHLAANLVYENAKALALREKDRGGEGGSQTDAGDGCESRMNSRVGQDAAWYRVPTVPGNGELQSVLCAYVYGDG